MKKQVLFSLLFSLLTLISADAQTFFTIENNWKNTSNKDRNSPLLSIEKGQLTISSDKTIEGLCIKIKDTTGHLISQEEICLAANSPPPHTYRNLITRKVFSRDTKRRQLHIRIS